MLRFALSIGLGVLAGAGIVALTAPPGAAAWALPVGLILTTLAGTFISIGRTTRTISTPDAGLTAAARAAQRVGLARVESVTTTGTRINDVPVCDIGLLVAPLHGGAYLTRSRMLLSPVQVAQLVPGTEVPVAILADGEPDVALLDETDERLLARVRVPRSADGLPTRLPAPGALRPDGTRSRPLISMDPATRWLRVPLFVLAFLVAAAAVVLPYRASALQSIDALREGRLHADMRDPAVIDDAIGELRGEVGGTSVFEVRASEDQIWFVVPLSDDGPEADDWWYRRGLLERYGAATVQPEDPRERFDASEVAWERLPGLADAAIAEAGLQEDAEVRITVERRPVDDIDSDDYMSNVGDVQISLSLSDDYHSRTFTADADGAHLAAQ